MLMYHCIWTRALLSLHKSLALSKTFLLSLDDNEQKHVASASDHYEGSHRRTSVIVPAGRVDTDRREAAESLLSIHSSPPMFTGEQSHIARQIS